MCIIVVVGDIHEYGAYHNLESGHVPSKISLTPSMLLFKGNDLFVVLLLNPGGGLYKAGNFVFSPVSSLSSWRPQVSHLSLLRLRNPVYLAQVCISNDRRFPTPGFKLAIN